MPAGPSTDVVPQSTCCRRRATILREVGSGCRRRATILREVGRADCVLVGMGRRLRYLPYPETLVEVTNRTIHGRFLLAPSKRMREITLGALGRAQRRYGVKIHAFVFLSNHYHLLISVCDALQMARFVGYFEAKLAKEVARRTNWRQKIWGRRYTAIPVSQEDAAQIERLRYLLAQGVKEGFVPHPADWPGAHSIDAMLEGSPLGGIWRDRTAEYRARCRGERPQPGDHDSEEVVELSVLPCWTHETPRAARGLARQLIEQIVSTARAVPKDYRRLLAKTRPTARPWRSKRSPAPWFHCASRTVRLELKRAYSEFLSAYRHAARRLQMGELTAPFPDGCFPPPRPLVSAR